MQLESIFDQVFSETDKQARVSCYFGHNHSSGADTVGKMYVYKDTQTYYCFSCHAYGNLSNISSEVSYKIQNQYDLEYAEEKKEGLVYPAKYYDYIFSDIENYQAIEYLALRKISLETAKKLNLKYDQYDNGIAFPLIDSDNFYGVQVRKIGIIKSDSKEQKITTKSALTSKRFIGQELYEDDKPTIIVEGLFGYAHLHEIGVGNKFNILCNCGTAPLTESKVNFLVNKEAKVYIFHDNDEAGNKMVYDFVGRKKHIKTYLQQLANSIDVYLPRWKIEHLEPDNLNFDNVKEMMYNSSKVTPIEEYKQASLF